MKARLSRPDSSEYAPYYQGYISLVPEGDIIETLTHQIADTLALLRGIPEDQADKSYAPGKWSVKEVVGHLIDSERIFGYRAMRFARNDATELPGFDQEDYVRNGGFGRRRLAELTDEFEHVRRANTLMFAGFDDETWMRRGVAYSFEVSVRALAFIIAGHERHHLIVSSYWSDLRSKAAG